jgi:hypothetical protein
LATVDPLAALEYVFENYLSYPSDDATPVTETFSNNGLDIEVFPQGKRHAFIAPMIEVGPISTTIVTPQNIGDSPNSRWLYRHLVECHLHTQDFQTPNISGYNGMVKIWEAIRALIVQRQSTIDGSGNWMLMKLSKGPYAGPDTQITPDRYDLAFIIELMRSAVD